VFVGKFCFTENTGSVSFKVSYQIQYAAQNMIFYYDDQWSEVYPLKKDLVR